MKVKQISTKVIPLGSKHLDSGGKTTAGYCTDID